MLLSKSISVSSPILRDISPYVHYRIQVSYVFQLLTLSVYVLFISILYFPMYFLYSIQAGVLKGGDYNGLFPLSRGVSQRGDSHSRNFTM